MAVVEVSPIKAVNTPLTSKAEPCVVIILGASGDLTRRKLIPALFDLNTIGALPEEFQLLGVGQEEVTDVEFRALVREGTASSRDVNEFQEDGWNGFAPRLMYMQGNLMESATYVKIAKRLEDMSRAGASANRLFYFSTPPSLAPSIIKGMNEAALAKEEKGWTRIIVEKPFGHDLASAQDLNTQIAQAFNEHQVYRIDHYLGKETVRNILVFRFGNSLFEPVWNRNYIDYVEITAVETLGIGSRAGYYEEAGALRDMMANHLLQLLTLTAMEPPVAFDADSVREEKVQILRSIRPMKPEEVAKRVVRGQYGTGRIEGTEVPAYRNENGVANDSITETYVAVEFLIENWRWAGVPFYVRTGKRLAEPLTEIAIHLKRTPQALFARYDRDQRIEPNVIVLRIQPSEGITVSFDAKLPGTEMDTGTVEMNFCYQTAFGMTGPAAYETLLLDAMQGDATLFKRRDEVEAEWRLIMPIKEAWGKEPAPDFPNYAAGSNGPVAADELLARNGHKWRFINSNTSRCGE
ncbi:MAG: glucose-6-phosphate dehydrogenase [Pyrinomonadaceae bacterium]|nr:glucose-6-phosphate dehydrogenase [Pyrinomonadaceae bacterium]